MPPRFAYWTIILDNVPTSFRTKDREEILPLFNQLKAKNPGALLKWFSGGRLWDSPEQAREVRDVDKVRRFRDERAKETKEQRELEAREMRAFREKHGRAGDDSGAPSTPPHDQNRPGHGRGMTRNGPEHPFRTGKPERRGRDWRPGGDHSDPRDKYKQPPGEARKRWKGRNLGPRGPKPFGSKPDGARACRASIWTNAGSPLLCIMQDLAASFESALHLQTTTPVHVAVGMTYGNPSMRHALGQLRDAGCRHVLVLPLYPQYSSPTTGSAFDAVARVLTAWRWVPELRTVSGYHDRSGYIQALARTVREFWGQNGEPECLLVSFHGMPKRFDAAGDPYRGQCEATTTLLLRALALDPTPRRRRRTERSRVGLRVPAGQLSRLARNRTSRRATCARCRRSTAPRNPTDGPWHHLADDQPDLPRRRGAVMPPG